MSDHTIVVIWVIKTFFLCSSSVSLVVQIVKNLPAMQETQF